jgi:hypothetical protein
MMVGTIGAVGSGQSVYPARLARAEAVAQRSDAALAQTQIAANGTATATVTSAPPFANPAIADIGWRAALRQALTPAAGVLAGDSGTVVQANAAVLFAAALVPLPASALGQPLAPVIPPPAIVTAPPRVSAVA